MAGKGEKLVDRASAGAIILSIARNNHTTDEIRIDLGKEWTTVLRQLNPLVEKKWIEKNEATKKYHLNETKLLDYWVKEFGLNRKVLKQHYSTWFAQFADSRMKSTINSLGVYFQINSKVLGSILEITKDTKKQSKKYPIKG